MQVLLPPPPASIPAIPGYLQSLWRSLTTALNSAVSSSEGAPRIILRSPNGTLYQVTVDDAGTLQTSIAPKGGL